jgi:hypothetical protein
MDELRMSSKERVRLDAMNRVRRKELCVVKAAALMGISVRQARRLWKRFRLGGDKGLVHQLRGKASNRRLDGDLGNRIIKRHQEQYSDFGPTLACEKLALEGMQVSPNTLTALLKQRGLWQRKRKRKRHRSRRERRSWFGSMIQMDGSHHDWFEGRRGKCVLMVLIDDASNWTYARFYEAETTRAAFDAFGRWVGLHGVPRSLYVDQHSIYRDQDHPQKPTQFGRAMKELDVELICAHSPQAKGRVERRNAVFQDRLVKELRLRGISDIQQANALLEGSFLEELNRRFAVSPAKSADMHRAVKNGLALEQVLCVRQERVVGSDWCVRWDNRFVQIHKEHEALGLAGKRVLVKQLGEGGLIVEHKGVRLGCQELPCRPEVPRARKVVVNNRRWKPSASHPWKKEVVTLGTGRAGPVTAASKQRGRGIGDQHGKAAAK